MRRKGQNTGFRVAGLSFEVIFCDETMTDAVATGERRARECKSRAGIRCGERTKRLREKMGVQGLRAGGIWREQ